MKGPPGLERPRRDGWWNSPAFRAACTFVAGYLGLSAILLLGPAQVLKGTFTAWTARATAWTLYLMGAGGEASGTLVTSSIFSADIIAECTAIFPLTIFVAAVLATPATWRRKLLGLAWGTPALLLLNLVRLVSLFYLGHWFPTAFETLHLLVWQSLMVLFTVMLWLVWAARSVSWNEPRRA